MTRRTLLSALASASAIPAFAEARKPRLRTAICAYSFRNQLESKSMKYEDLIPLAVETNADGLDLTVYWFPSTEDSFLLPLRELAYRNAVELYSISVRTDLCKPPGAARDKQAVALRQWVDVAAKLGASHIRVFGGTVPKDSRLEQSASWVVQMLRSASEYSGSKGVILGLENHGGVTQKASTIVGIVQELNSPWVGINLDTGNFDRDAYAQIASCAPHAVNVQFKTEIKDETGKSQKADWPRLVGMLSQSGYRGYLALEYEEKENAMERVPTLTRELNQLAKR